MSTLTARPGPTLTTPSPVSPMPDDSAGLPTSGAVFLFRYVRRRPWLFGLLLALVSAAAGCSVAVQYGMKLIVDQMAIGPPHNAAIWGSLALFVVLIGAESALWRLGGWLGCHTVVATGVDVRLDLFRHLAQHPMHFFSGQMSGALGNRVTATAGALGGLISNLIWHIVPPCVDFLGALVILSALDVRMAVALVSFAAVVGLVIALFGARGRPLHKAYAEQGAKVNGELVDTVVNIWTVKAFSARRREQARLDGLFGNEARAQRRSWLYTEKARVLHDLLLWVMASGMLAWAIQGWRIGERTPGDVVVISALTFRILHGSRDLALSLVEALQQLGIVNEMLSVIGGALRVDGVADPPSAPDFVPGPGQIDIRHVRFAYADGPPIFDGFDLFVPAGQRLGVVGPSGSGKSTLVALIQRLADVQQGCIVIDGQSVTELSQDSLRESIAVVPQEIALFHRSVAENLRYGRPDASDDEVRQAASRAHCDDFIGALPQGYETLVGERGARLSGGQRQRIGIARAFLKEAPILLLDEATSSLDSVSEHEIKKTLDRLMRNRTVIAVAHRLSTVDSFDRIIVLDKGRIVEDGPPAVLRTAGGLYERLWELQSHGLETE